MTSTSTNFISLDDLLLHLKDTPFAAHHVEVLNGGYVNMTYRLRLNVPYNDKTSVVMKHARHLTFAGLEFGVVRQVRMSIAIPHLWLD
jgi:hypothetical protein